MDLLMLAVIIILIIFFVPLIMRGVGCFFRILALIAFIIVAFILLEMVL